MRLTNFDMDALRSFVSGVEAGSFARAAEQLGRSTSAISAQLQKLEDQAGVPLMRKSGRGLQPTEAGEMLLGYARRILALNDEAAGALRGGGYEGWLRLGLQADFGEPVLTEVLGRFSRNHPRVQIEGRIGCNADLIARAESGQLDLALVWDDGQAHPQAERLASVPLAWIGATGHAPLSREGPLPIVALEAPCILRSLAATLLDRAGLSWRIAFVSPSLGGLWAATAAGLGLGLRSPVGCPAGVSMLDPVAHGLPAPPALDLLLIRGSATNPASAHLAEILTQAVADTLAGLPQIRRYQAGISETVRRRA